MDVVLTSGHPVAPAAAQHAPASAPGLATAVPGEYLCFRLGAEEYGIDLLKVQEIRSYEAPTRIANAPASVKGVLNLRGAIMPVVDLRIGFGCDPAIDPSTVVIVLNTCRQQVGVVVDSVSDVVLLAPAAIQPVPPLVARIESTCISGIAREHERTLVLLDIDALMALQTAGLHDDGGRVDGQSDVTHH